MTSEQLATLLALSEDVVSRDREECTCEDEPECDCEEGGDACKCPEAELCDGCLGCDEDHVNHGALADLQNALREAWLAALRSEVA